MGPSGSGKSTLLYVVGTLEPPTSGTVTLGGRDPFRLPEPELAAFRNRQVGFVFQDHCLLPQCSVLENVLLPTLVAEGRDGHLERAQALLEQVGLGERLDHRPAELSGGERQRVAIARALVSGPSVLICDEVTSALDVSVQAAIVELLAELQRDLGLAMLFVTHNLPLVRSIAGRVAVMSMGRIVELGWVEQVINSPADEYTQRLLADTPSLETATA
jgi:lipoprotein-releasing system ATP-binding protein